MPIAVGDKVYEDEFQYKLDSIGIRPVEQPSTTSTMPPQAPEKPAGEFKSSGGTGTPENQYETSLSPQEEVNFQSWKAQNAPNDSGFDYDLRGAFQAGVQPDATTGHWPDTFKKPNHPTFSTQSQYAKDRSDLAGTWDGDTYHPAPYGLNPPEREAPFPRPRMTEILKGFYETAKNALGLTQAPPWALDQVTGEIHTSPQAIEKAADLAGLMTFGPAPVASKLAEGSLGSFAGVTSKTLDKNKLAQAQVMESNAVSRDDIWRKTGMFRGADNRWRYEIHDADMQLKEGAFDKTVTQGEEGITYTPRQSGLPPLPENASLEDVLSYVFKSRKTDLTLEQAIDHPELFKAYPELRGIKVRTLPGEELEMGTRGMMSGRNLYLAPNLSKEEIRSVIMHEVQHEIQHIEGFAMGGSSDMFRTKQLDAAEAFFKNVRTQTEKDIVAQGYTPEELVNLKAFIADSLKGKPLNSEVAKMLEEAKDNPIIKQLRNIVQSELHLDDALQEHLELYRRLKGEVEARNVQARLDYEQRTRQLIPPYTGEDRHRLVQNEPPPPWGKGPIKSQEPIPFRRAANENLPSFKEARDSIEKQVKEGKVTREAADDALDSLFAEQVRRNPESVYNPNERNMIGSKEADAALDKWWNRQVESSEMQNEIDRLLAMPDDSALHIARINKLQKKWQDEYGPK